MMKIIKKFDLLSKQIPIRTSETKIGRVNSFIIILIGLLITLYYFIIVIQKDLQTVIIKNYNDVNAPQFNYSKFLPFVIRIENEVGKFYENKSLLTISSVYKKCDRDGNDDFQCDKFLLNLTNCNPNNFPDEFYDQFEFYDFYNALCIDFNSNPLLNNSITIKGSWTENSVYYINYALNTCSNKSYCINDTKLIEKIILDQSLYLSYYVFEENLQPFNYSYPSQMSIKNIYSNIGLNIYKSYNDLLSLVNVTSDIGLVYSQMNQTSLIQNDLKLVDVTLNTDAKNALTELFIYSNKSGTDVIRNYMRIQSALAIISTVMRLVFKVFKIVFKDWIDVEFYESIIDKIINYKTVISPRKKLLKYIVSNTEHKDIHPPQKNDNNLKSQNISIIRLKDVGLSQMNVLYNLRKPAETNANSNDIDNKIIMNSDALFQIKFYEFLSFHCCCKQNEKINTKKKFYEQARIVIEGFSDFVNLINLHQEVEVLKNILLNDQELKRFQNVFKHSFNKKIDFHLFSIISDINNDPELSDIKKIIKSKVGKRLFDYVS